MSTKDIPNPNALAEARIGSLKENINIALKQAKEIFDSLSSKPGRTPKYVADRVGRLDVAETELGILRMESLENLERDESEPRVSIRIEDLKETETTLEEFSGVRSMFLPIKSDFKRLLSLTFLRKEDGRFKERVAAREFNEIKAIRTTILETANVVGLRVRSRLIYEIEDAILSDERGGIFISIGESKAGYIALPGLDIELVGARYSRDGWL